MHALTLGLLVTLAFLASFLLISLMVPAFIRLIEHLSAATFPNQTDRAAERIARRQEAARKAAEIATERAGDRAQKIREESAEALLDGAYDFEESGRSDYEYDDEEDDDSVGGGDGDGDGGGGGGALGGFFDSEALQYGSEDPEENAGVVKVGLQRWW